MDFKFATWNVERSFGNTRRALIFDGISQLDADIFVAQEAYMTDENSTQSYVDDVEGRISQYADTNGYNVCKITEYNEENKRTLPERLIGYEDYLLLLSRDLVRRTAQIRIGGRNALELDIQDETGDIKVQGFAAHFDDRSNDYRNASVVSLMDKLVGNRPTIIGADMNSLPLDSIQARILRASITNKISKMLPLSEKKSWYVERAIDMAQSSVTEDLEQAGFVNSDPKHHSTIKAFGILPFGKLDHIFVRTTTDLHPNITAKNITSGNIKGSDHKPVLAQIHVELTD